MYEIRHQAKIRSCCYETLSYEQSASSHTIWCDTPDYWRSQPPASSLVMSSPRTMYAPSSAQITPAYPQQNYPQQPYATQPAVFTYPLQPALSTSANARYPTQSSSASSYPPQPAIAPHQPHHPAPKPDVHPHQLTGKTYIHNRVIIHRGQRMSRFKQHDTHSTSIRVL
ncbi:hypothetical protein BSL78_04668 [Apostichopus japonicus]|uniref:Uncharacterized protein n=1 Tax=Stichopus japonicus TaxID=307972 RepID=A0A2G8LDZ7_STIJA|nr:hypothetical protein BSL78_04668 [Apostichopus japonicus]